MRFRCCKPGVSLGVLIATALLLASTACGGAGRGATSDLPPLPQPTPDPTLDAVVRSEPRLAPVATATPAPSRQAAAKPTPTPARSR